MSGRGPKTHFLTSAERKCLQSIKGNADKTLLVIGGWGGWMDHHLHAFQWKLYFTVMFNGLSSVWGSRWVHSAYLYMYSIYLNALHYVLIWPIHGNENQLKTIVWIVLVDHSVMAVWLNHWYWSGLFIQYSMLSSFHATRCIRPFPSR